MLQDFFFLADFAPNGSVKVTDLNIVLQCFSDGVKSLVEKLLPCGLILIILHQTKLLLFLKECYKKCPKQVLLNFKCWKT